MSKQDAKLTATDLNFLEDWQSTNFEDVLPLPVKVSLMEYKEVVVEEVGEKVVRRKPHIRVAEINTYVPMSIFHGMLAGQERIRRLQALQQSVQDGNKDAISSQQELLEWLSEQVLAVWQLTEPDMTLKRLTDGIDFKRMLGLFGCFFGNQLKELSA